MERASVAAQDARFCGYLNALGKRSEDFTMAQSHVSLGQDPAFDTFLGATIGTDAKGKAVTVLSMLSRLDLDPWLEASQLSAMANAAARQRLGTLVSRFTDVPSPAAERGDTVARLVSLLPKGAAGIASVAMPAGRSLPVIGRQQSYWIFAALMVLCYVAFRAFGA
ncbi:hypothetical protein AB4874_03630 [Thioclava sp. 15-R06ZXC-3]|uniref:Uncharacterized protein n=1 Tax=Thioclava arctica TaxID=3238301 RepID=A0ABV3TI01_9RHOB